MLWLVSVAARVGVPERLQRAAAWIAIVVAALALFGAGVAFITWWIGNERTEAIQGDRALSASEANTIAARAEAIASTNMVEQVRNDTINDEELHHEVRKGDDRAVGPGTTAVLNKLRQQQAESRRGEAAR